MAYTCQDYRQEMKLLAYKRRLAEDDLSDVERGLLIKEIEKIETLLGMCDPPAASTGKP